MEFPKEKVVKKKVTRKMSALFLPISPTYAGEQKSVPPPGVITFKAMPSSTVPSPGAELKSFSVRPRSPSSLDVVPRSKPLAIPKRSEGRCKFGRLCSASHDFEYLPF